MIDMKIAVIVGSLRAESYNKTLARVIAAKLPQDTEVEYIDLTDVPFMNEDLEIEMPWPVAQATTQVMQADGVLIVSPEYNRGIPAVTKNIIDWLSRGSTGSTLINKPVAIAGISTGPIKTLVMQSQLRLVLAHVGAHVMTSPVLALTVGKDNMQVDGTLSEVTEGHVDAFARLFVQHIQLYTRNKA